MIMRLIKSHPIRLTVVITIIINIILVIIVILFINKENSKTSSMDILISPSSAKILINNQEYQNGKYDFEPGQYNVIIKKDGLVTKEMNLQLESGVSMPLHTYLVGENNNFDYYKYNKTDYYLLTNIVTDNDYDAKNFISNCEKLMQIKDVLPVTEWIYNDAESKRDAGGFKIEDGSGYSNCPEIFCIGVTYYYKKYPGRVLEKIRELGYDPNQYKIIYKEVNT